MSPGSFAAAERDVPPTDAVARTPAALRVEMVVPSLPGAGMEVMVADLVRALGARGHTVGVTCVEERGTLADRLEDEGFRVSLVPTPGFLANAYAPALAGHFRQWRPDVVHVHSGVWTKAARAAKHAGVSVVGHTAHGLLDDEPWIGPALKRWAARSSDWVAAVSQPLARYLTRDVGIDDRAVTVIPNGIDTDRFAPGRASGALRARLGLPSAGAIVGTVARLAPVKDQALLIAAFARLAAELPDATLVLVGDGPLRAALGESAAAHGVTDRVRFYGAADDVAQIYRELDLFVLSSKSEGTSMSTLEAMASGTPVVATAVGGTPDLLDHGRCGLLVDSRAPEALADAMLDSLRNEASTRARAAAARQRVLAHYSQASMVERYESLYRSPRDKAGATSTKEMSACAE